MEENFNKHLGNKLKLRRLALGLTQTKVSRSIIWWTTTKMCNCPSFMHGTQDNVI